MLDKLLDLLGLSDGGEVVVTDYRDQKRRERFERLKEHSLTPGRGQDPAGGDIPAEDGIEERDEAEDVSRKERIYQPLPIVPGLILVRGNNCVKLLDDLGGALKLGKLVLLDLQGIDVEGGQKVLSSLYELVRAMHGGFFRIDRSCFLVSPVKGCVEEWTLESDEAEGPDEE